MKDYRCIINGRGFAGCRKGWCDVLCMIIVNFSLSFFCSSCGTPDGCFRIEGRLRNINQGEFYVYSLDGGPAGLDTIHIADGRFSYETPLSDDATFILVFPNFSEHVVFGRSGATAKIEGDVSHLKEIEVEGTDENRQMTELRKHIANQTPPERKKSALQFINDNPGSIVSIYLIDKFLLQEEKPDYKEVYALVGRLIAKSPDNARLLKLRQQLEVMKDLGDNARLPDFTATDIMGKYVNAFSLKSELNVIMFWATWNSDSYSLISRMQAMKKEYGPRLALLSVCIDAQKGDCQRRAERDSLKWPTVCDERMWDSPLLRKFAVTDVPDNIVADRSGRVIARGLTVQKLEEKIKERLDKKK